MATFSLSKSDTAGDFDKPARGSTIQRGQAVACHLAKRVSQYPLTASGEWKEVGHRQGEFNIVGNRGLSSEPFSTRNEEME
jgi:hypothetical protein